MGGHLPGLKEVKGMRRSVVGAVMAGALILTGCVEQDGNQRPALETGAGVSAGGRPGSLGQLRLARPVWQVGDEWRYSDGYAVRVQEAGPVLTRFERLDVPGRWFDSNGLFREKSQSGSGERQVVFRSENPDRLYAVPQGQPVVFVREYLHDKQLVRHQTSWVVESRETVTVPAGTFDAFVLVMRTRSLTGNWTGYERWWYAPAVKNYVRLEYKYGQAPEGARVLMSYRVSP